MPSNWNSTIAIVNIGQYLLEFFTSNITLIYNRAHANPTIFLFQIRLFVSFDVSRCQSVCIYIYAIYILYDFNVSRVLVNVPLAFWREILFRYAARLLDVIVYIFFLVFSFEFTFRHVIIIYLFIFLHFSCMPIASREEISKYTIIN